MGYPRSRCVIQRGSRDGAIVLSQVLKEAQQ